MSNKKAKERLIQLYGAECFIDKLHLRVDKEPRRYKSKGQYKRMKQLTYHHIKERQHGGKATIENGALLSTENHEWFNKQSKEAQKQMNELFQKYKESAKCGVELVDELDTDFSIATAIIVPAELEKNIITEQKRKERGKKKSRRKDR